MEFHFLMSLLLKAECGKKKSSQTEYVFKRGKKRTEKYVGKVGGAVEVLEFSFGGNRF